MPTLSRPTMLKVGNSLPYLKVDNYRFPSYNVEASRYPMPYLKVGNAYPFPVLKRLVSNCVEGEFVLYSVLSSFLKGGSVAVLEGRKGLAECVGDYCPALRRIEIRHSSALKLFFRFGSRRCCVPANQSPQLRSKLLF